MDNIEDLLITIGSVPELKIVINNLDKIDEEISNIVKECLNIEEKINKIIKIND